MAKPTQAASLGLLILRAVTGVIFAMHGWQKFSSGIAGIAEGFGHLGIPAPEVMGSLLATLELAGGVALILGLLTRLIAFLLMASMMVALFLVHMPNGFFVTEGGYEFVLALAGMAATLALTGPGRLSVDAVAFGPRGSKLLSP